MDYIIIENMCFSFRNHKIFENAELKVSKGEVVGVVGKNGSGKSVLFKIIAGLIKPQEGQLVINGRNMLTSDEFTSDLGILIEEPSYLNNLSALENLELLRRIQNKVPKESVTESLKKVNLFDSWDNKVKTYSLGMRKKLGIAQAIMESPQLLLLDEPMNALDEESVLVIRDLIRNLSCQGVTILLASHNSKDIELLCHRVYKIEDKNLVSYKTSFIGLKTDFESETDIENDVAVPPSYS